LKALASGCRKLEFLNLSGAVMCDDDALKVIRAGCPRLQKLLAERCWLVGSIGTGAPHEPDSPGSE